MHGGAAYLRRTIHSGQSLPKCDVRDMSGFPSIATDERTSRDVSNVPIGDIDFDYSIIGTGEVCFHPLPSSFLTIVLPLVHALMITHADLGAAKAQGLCVDNGGLSRLNTRSWT